MSDLSEQALKLYVERDVRTQHGFPGPGSIYEHGFEDGYRKASQSEVDPRCTAEESSLTYDKFLLRLEREKRMPSSKDIWDACYAWLVPMIGVAIARREYWQEQWKKEVEK